MRGLVDHCLLIETQNELVLVDTGFGVETVRNPGKMLGPTRFTLGAKLAESETAIRQIQALGHDPRDVRHIILTHLDVDHCGGLSDFPEATVHVHGPEFRAATATPTFSEKLRYRAANWSHGPKWMVNEVEGGEDWFGFRAVRGLEGLPPEILVVPLAGHTRGHAGVAIDTGAGWLLHAGDSYFVESSIHPETPVTPFFWKMYETGSVLGEAYRENQKRLRELQRLHGHQVTIINSHDAVVFARAAGL